MRCRFVHVVVVNPFWTQQKNVPFFPDDWVVCVPILGVCTWAAAAPIAPWIRGVFAKQCYEQHSKMSLFLCKLVHGFFWGGCCTHTVELVVAFWLSKIFSGLCAFSTFCTFFKSNACDITTSSQIEDRRRHFIIYCRHIINCNFYRFKAPARYFVEVTLVYMQQLCPNSNCIPQNLLFVGTILLFWAAEMSLL